MKTLLITLFTILTISTAQAQESCAIKDNDIHVNVNGLVCDFCARALEKVFSKKEQVSSIAVDMGKALVIVTLNDGHTLTDEELTTLITDSGYNVTTITRECS